LAVASSSILSIALTTVPDEADMPSTAAEIRATAVVVALTDAAISASASPDRRAS
jgi:hypothetical protein